MIVRLRRRPRATLFPYTTLFRSCVGAAGGAAPGDAAEARSGRLGRPGPVVLGVGRLRDLHDLGAQGRRHPFPRAARARARSEEHTSELQSLAYLVCRLLLEKKND